MEIAMIDVLHGLRTALQAPPEKRTDLYVERVMEPLRPFWESALAYVPPEAQARLEEVARSLWYYTPDLGVDAGLEAVSMLERAGTMAACREAVERAFAALQPDVHGIAYDRMQATVLLIDPEKIGTRGGGYSGLGGRPGQVCVLVWPNEFNVPRLPAAMAHEVHHNVRLQWEPWTPDTTVGQYVVLEGLAEAFAAELYGDDLVGRWVTGLSDADHEMLKPRFREAIDVSGFDEIRGYIFGDWAAEQFKYTPQRLPDFAGYAVGYRIARAYLARTGRSAAVATYVPWREIVEESRYFAE